MKAKKQTNKQTRNSSKSPHCPQLLSLILILLASTFTLPLQAQLDFTEHPIQITETDGATDVFAVDLDGDGDIDVLSASENDNKIGWYENPGNGNFSTQNLISDNADGARSVYAIDLDGDGDNDVLSASQNDSKIAWYENLGEGSFSGQNIISTNAEGARSVYATDLDGDGDNDVLSASFNDDKIAWYENLGGGTFSGQNVISTNANGANSVYATDLDGDGDNDVLSASFNDDKIAWYENLGGGTFSGQNVISTNANGANSVYATDLDGDGDNDVLSASFNDDKIAWYENLGNGNFSNQNVITTLANGANSVHATDLDGDGDADVLSASSIDYTIARYENLGGGDFSGQVISNTAFSAQSVFAADLNGNGYKDALSASYEDDKIAWYNNLGNGNFSSQHVITISLDNPQSVYATDLDEDGDADVLSGSYEDGKISWYENLGNGNFSTQNVISTNADEVWFVYAADLDGDGDADVLSASSFWPNNGKITWHENLGDGNFSGQNIISTNVESPRSVYATDLDGDGDNDVLSASFNDDKITWYENLGNGIFSEPNVISVNADGAWSVYAIDLDLDGDADVLSASHNDDKIAWYENLGGGSFGEQNIISVNAVAAKSVYATDLDEDGYPDVLSASSEDDKIAWYENLGGGSFSEQNVISTNSSGTRSVYAADLDIDGDIDVLSASINGGKIAWYENLGDGNFSQENIISLNASGARSVYATDLDGDGGIDVLSASYNDDKIAWYENLLPLTVTLFINNLPCVEVNNGSVQVQLTSLLLPPYTYSWSLNGEEDTGNGSSESESFSINDLAEGVYEFTFVNAQQDTATASIQLTTVVGSFFEIIDITSTNSSNLQSNGSIQISVDGGTAPYTYTWSGPTVGSETVEEMTYEITAIPAGTYDITITDFLGNEAMHSVTLLDETEPVNTCEGPLDIIILNDVSGSVDAVEYAESKQFFVDFINALNVGPGEEESRVGIVEWSSSGKQEIKVPIAGELADLQNYVNASRSFSGGTNPNTALTYGYNYLEGEARENVPKLLVLSTDGSSNQVSGSLVALAEQYKAEGYIIVTIAFDGAFSNQITRETLRQTASIDLLAPGAPAYSQLNSDLAENIVNIYVCPLIPGSSNTIYFNRDGVLEITGYTPNDFCPNPESVTVHLSITAQQQLSLPAGTPISFYYNNPALFGSTYILTSLVSCAVPPGETEEINVTLPVSGPANIWAVLNDDGSQNPPVNLPVTDIEEIVYINNIDNITVCTEPLPTLSALKYTLTPIPICDTLVIYTVDVCNISGEDAFGVEVTDIPPSGFELLTEAFNDNGCSSEAETGYDIPAGCCVSLTYTYDASDAAPGLYNNQGVEVNGPDSQIYEPFDAGATSTEDVTIGEDIACDSDVVLFSKSVNLIELCGEGFLSYTFTIDNQTNVALQGLSFSDILPEGVIWAGEPYFVQGLSIGQTQITGSNEAVFPIAEVQAETVASFVMDAYIDGWTESGTITNTANISGWPDFVNGDGAALSATSEVVTIHASPIVEAVHTVEITAGQTAQLSAQILNGINPEWVTTGDGVIDNPNAEMTFYTPGPNDIEQGFVQFSVSVFSPLEGCGTALDTVLLTILPPASEPIEVILLSDICHANGTATLYYQVTGGLPAIDEQAAYTMSGSYESENELSAGDVFEVNIEQGAFAELTVTDADGNLVTTTDGPFECVTLAVSLSRFIGTAQPSGNLLEWTTLTENNHAYFEVLRLGESGTFEAIGQVTGSGNSVSQNDYDFLDKNPPVPVAYYQLRSVDQEGKVSNSGIVVVHRSEGDAVYISLQPNPAREVVYLLVNGRGDTFEKGVTSATYRLYNHLGQLLKGGEFTGDTHPIDLSDLPPAVYFIRVNTAGAEERCLKVVKGGFRR